MGVLLFWLLIWLLVVVVSASPARDEKTFRTWCIEGDHSDDVADIEAEADATSWAAALALVLLVGDRGERKVDKTENLDGPGDRCCGCCGCDWS